MFKFTKIFVLLLAISLISLTSCNDDSNPLNNSTDKIIEINNIVKGYDWIITKMKDSGKEYTDEFSGYTFTFNTDGTLFAVSSDNSYTGTWWIGDDDTDDDSDDSSDDVDFNIRFQLSNYFSELNDDWEILSYTSNKIELIDRSDDGDDDYLTFERK